MIKEIKQLLFKNIKEIIKFELIYKLITVLIATPIFMKSFDLIMQITGYKYLTLENIFSFILNPITIILIIILLVIIAFYSIFEIGTIIILFDASKQNKRIKLKDAITTSLKKSIKIFKPKNWVMIILLLFLIPFLNIGITTGVISTINIPEFIMDFIYANMTLTILFVTIMIALTFWLLKWIYSFHYYFIEDKTVKEATKSSKGLSKKKHLKDFIRLIIPQIIITVVFILNIIIGIFLIILISNIFVKLTFLNSLLLSIIEIFILLLAIVFYALNTAIGYSCLSMLFYKHKEEAKENIKHISFKESNKKSMNKVLKYLIWIGIVIGIVIFSIFNYNLLTKNFNFNIEYVKNIEITAHRGDSVNYPENTMAAFIGAKEKNAKWVELDIQQSKDGKIFVSHDSNFKRLAGVDLNSWEVTYDEISKLDVGSFKDEKFKGEKMPLLADVIDWAKTNNIKLNIELKPTGHEENFERQTIDMIYNKHFEDDCVLTSQVYNVIQNIKNIDNKIKTVYVMSLAYGNILSFDKADCFSIEASNITENMVNEVHNSGKQIYAWTINTKESINNMIALNVDNIITDDVTLAQEVVFKSKKSNVLVEFIDFIFLKTLSN